MPRRRSMFSSSLHAIAVPIAGMLLSARLALMSALRSRRAIPVEVVITDATRRRAVAGEVRRTLHQLRRTLGADLPADLAIIVQQTVTTDHPLAGCVQTRQRADGTRSYLVRLALQIDGRRLAIDDVLAALTDVCVGIVVQSGGPSVLIPLAATTGPHGPAATPPVLRPDPLASNSNGTITRAQAP